jgi:hypothetical protein
LILLLVAVAEHPALNSQKTIANRQKEAAANEKVNQPS